MRSQEKKYNFPHETLVIDEWLFLEYAAYFLPMNQDTLDESVRKTGLDLPSDFLHAIGVDPSLIVPKHAPPAVVPFTPLAEVEKAVRCLLAAIDVEALVRKSVEEVYEAADLIAGTDRTADAHWPSFADISPPLSPAQTSPPHGTLGIAMSLRFPRPRPERDDRPPARRPR